MNRQKFFHRIAELPRAEKEAAHAIGLDYKCLTQGTGDNSTSLIGTTSERLMVEVGYGRNLRTEGTQCAARPKCSI